MLQINTHKFTISFRISSNPISLMLVNLACGFPPHFTFNPFTFWPFWLTGRQVHLTGQIPIASVSIAISKLTITTTLFIFDWIAFVLFWLKNSGNCNTKRSFALLFFSDDTHHIKHRFQYHDYIYFSEHFIYHCSSGNFETNIEAGT